MQKIRPIGDGHFPAYEQPALFTQDVRAFFTGLAV